MLKKSMHFNFMFLLSFCLSVVSSAVSAQGVEDLEEARKKQMQELGVLLPNPKEIRAMADLEFSKEVGEQDPQILTEIAKRANLYSNLVSKISDKYNDYIRDNSRYDFVVDAVRGAAVVPSFLALDSEFKGMRNRAYLNLGIIAMNEGKEMEAFWLFNDAYRLSVFDCDDGIGDCTRYQAEQYMKNFLGLEGQSYIYWEK